MGLETSGTQAHVESKFDSLTAVPVGRSTRTDADNATHSQRLRTVGQKCDENDVAVETSLRLLRDLDKQLASRVPDPEERKKFVIASYNPRLIPCARRYSSLKNTDSTPEKWTTTSQSDSLEIQPEILLKIRWRISVFARTRDISITSTVYAYYAKSKIYG